MVELDPTFYLCPEELLIVMFYKANKNQFLLVTVYEAKTSSWFTPIEKAVYVIQYGKSF